MMEDRALVWPVVTMFKLSVDGTRKFKRGVYKTLEHVYMYCTTSTHTAHTAFCYLFVCKEL